MSRRRGFLRRPKPSDEMSLQITSMADIFMILLVFLLKGYSTSVVNVTPTSGLMLPEAQAQEQSVEALKVEIAKDAVLVEGMPVTTLKDFQFNPSEKQANGTLKALAAKFELERKRQLMIAKQNSDVKVDPRIMVIADQRVPYATIKAVLASAAVQGYTDFKLATVRGD